MAVIELSITGAFKMILMIVGALVLLRFVGQLMQAKKNMEHERDLNQRQRAFEAESKEKKRNLGKTKILGKNPKLKDGVEDVEFEEID